MGDGSALSQSLDLVGGTLTGDGWGRRRVGRGLGGSMHMRDCRGSEGWAERIKRHNGPQLADCEPLMGTRVSTCHR